MVALIHFVLSECPSEARGVCFDVVVGFLLHIQFEAFHAGTDLQVEVVECLSLLDFWILVPAQLTLHRLEKGVVEFGFLRNLARQNLVGYRHEFEFENVHVFSLTDDWCLGGRQDRTGLGL